jgi:hypothetical protein
LALCHSEHSGESAVFLGHTETADSPLRSE